MRRLCRLLCAALLTGGLLLPAAPVTAVPDSLAAAPRDLLLATEGGEAEPPGPEPSPPDASGNPAAPRTYDANFLWGAATGLLVLTVAAVAGLTGLYFLLVVRPRRQEAEAE